MGEKKQNLYEGMYIISATLSEDARNKALERIQNEITSRGGEIHKTHDQGKKEWLMRLKAAEKAITTSSILALIRLQFPKFGKNIIYMKI